MSFLFYNPPSLSAMPEKDKEEKQETVEETKEAITSAKDWEEKPFRPTPVEQVREQIKASMREEILRNLTHDRDKVFYDAIRPLWPESPPVELVRKVGELFPLHLQTLNKTNVTEKSVPDTSPNLSGFGRIHDLTSMKYSGANISTPFLDFARPILGLYDHKYLETGVDFESFWYNQNDAKNRNY